jgi:hypothetical protein
MDQMMNKGVSAGAKGLMFYMLFTNRLIPDPFLPKVVYLSFCIHHLSFFIIILI